MIAPKTVATASSPHIFSLRNSRGELFEVVWERVDPSHFSDLMTDPRSWPIEPEEGYWVRQLRGLPNGRLLEIFHELHPQESYSSLLEFIDEITNSPGMMSHHLVNARGKIIVLQQALESGQGYLEYKRLLDSAYKEKALIREIVARWCLDGELLDRLLEDTDQLPHTVVGDC